MKKVIQVWGFAATGYDSMAMQPVEEFETLSEAEKAMKEPIVHVPNKNGSDYCKSWRGRFPELRRQDESPRLPFTFVL
jgi:hypothetical protein